MIPAWQARRRARAGLIRCPVSNTPALSRSPRRVWWSIVTLATVGYGDVVPHTAWGRVLGGFVIVFGVTFLSFLVAIVTSLFVDANRADDKDERNAQHQENQALLRDLAHLLRRQQAGEVGPQLLAQLLLLSGLAQVHRCSSALG